MALAQSSRPTPPEVLSVSELCDLLRKDLYVRRISWEQLAAAMVLDKGTIQAVLKGGQASELTRVRMTMYYKQHEVPGWNAERPKSYDTYTAERGKLLRQINGLQRELRTVYKHDYPRPYPGWTLAQLRRTYALADWYVRKEFIKRFRQQYPNSKFLFFDSETYWVWKQRLRAYQVEGKL